ncbi:MAG: histidine kinase [Pseudomonadota bacterium]
MDSNRSKLVIGIAWLLFWAMMVSVAIQDFQRNHAGGGLWQPVLWESSSMVAVSLLLVCQRHFTRPFDALLATPARWFLLQALWLPLYWVAFVPIAFGIRHAAYALAGSVYHHEAWPETFFYESLKISVFFGLFVLISFGILSYHALLEEKLRAEKSTALLRLAQLQRLTQQMQPHFLFNALNTISSLMRSDVDKADATLIQLADLLRTTLDLNELHEAPLATELRLVRGYARVMEERYAGRVSVDWNIAPDTLGCTVPVMSLQPLLENIFKHTVEQRRGLTRIAVSASRADGVLTVVLEDDSGTLAPGPAPGIGVRNLRERLAVLYGERAALQLSQRAPAGVRAHLSLPCGC